MIVDNGTQSRLVIPGVFEGMCGVSRGKLWFVPNSDRLDPARATVGILDEQAIRIQPVKDSNGPGWSARYEVMV